MEKPLTKKQFNQKVKQRIVYGIVIIALGVLGYFVRSFFSDSKSSSANQIVGNKNSDSLTSNTINNKDVYIDGDQVNAGHDVNIDKRSVDVKGDKVSAGRDANIDNRKIEVKGNAFFDSAKQINYYQGITQRHLDLTLMQKILDSIPTKDTKIEILAGGGKEGENLAKEISNFFEERGYKKPVIIPWSLTGNWDITEYHYDNADNTFRIDIHPQSNDQQIH